jgi:hypothetical protein
MRAPFKDSLETTSSIGRTPAAGVGGGAKDLLSRS